MNNTRIWDRRYVLAADSTFKDAVVDNKCTVCRVADGAEKEQARKRFEVDGYVLCKHKGCGQPGVDKFCAVHQRPNMDTKLSSEVNAAITNITVKGIEKSSKGLKQLLANVKAGNVILLTWSFGS